MKIYGELIFCCGERHASVPTPSRPRDVKIDIEPLGSDCHCGGCGRPSIFEVRIYSRSFYFKAEVPCDKALVKFTYEVDEL